MEKFTFVELTKKESCPNNNSRDIFGSDSCNLHQFIYTHSTKTVASNITFSLCDKTYNYKTDYALIYLYDIENDKYAKPFLQAYGANIHNRTSANISFITYYNDEIASSWNNVYNRLELNNKEGCNILHAKEVIKELKKKYEVNTLPAVIVLKKEPKKLEHSCVFSGLERFNVINLERLFNKIIETIDKNCSKDFEDLENELKVVISGIKRSSLSQMDLYELIYALVKEEAKQHPGYTQGKLALELGICEKTLRNKRVYNSFTKDELMYLAIRFKLSEKTLNEMLENCGYAGLGFSERDCVIRECLHKKLGINNTNLMLKKQNLELI